MKGRTSLVVLAGLLLLAFPAFADDDDNNNDDHDGDFFIGVEARFLQPSGLPADFVLVDPDSDDDPEGVVQSVEFSNEVSPRIVLGWSGDDDSSLALSWWSYDEQETASASAADPMELWTVLYHPRTAFFDFEGTAVATAGVDATVIDLTYSRPAHEGDRFAMRWMAGLRQADLDFGLDVTYSETVSINESQTVALTSEAEGIGITGGLNGYLTLADDWFVAGGVQYSFLTGEVEASTFMFNSIDGIAAPNADVVGEEDRVIGIFDLQCSVVWHPIEDWYFWLGYEFSQWSNVVDTQLFPDDWGPGFLQTDSTDVTWDGFKLGAGYRF
jgi:hypothetical protein